MFSRINLARGWGWCSLQPCRAHARPQRHFFASHMFLRVAIDDKECVFALLFSTLRTSLQWGLDLWAPGYEAWMELSPLFLASIPSLVQPITKQICMRMKMLHLRTKIDSQRDLRLLVGWDLLISLGFWGRSRYQSEALRRLLACAGLLVSNVSDLQFSLSPFWRIRNT